MSGIIDYIPDKNMPVGVFDSGVGGISTLKELVRMLPGENFIYYGDHANAPYGCKSAEEVKELSFSAARYLIQRKVKAIVIACNTATSAAAAALRNAYPDIRIIGAEPAVKPAVTEFPGGEVIVMATSTTLSEQKYKDLCGRLSDKADIIPLSCPGLMDFVERGELSGNELKEYLENRLYPVMSDRTRAIVLGCTHYPFVSDAISEVAGERVKLFDGNKGIAKELKRRLEEAGLLSCRENGSVEYTGSGLDERINKLTEMLMEI